MDIFTFILTAVISFLGLLLGLVLAQKAPEEIHAFKKYLPFAQLLIFVLIFVVFFAFLPFFIALALLVLSFAFIFIFWHKKNLNTLDYIVLGVLFALTSLSAELHWYMTLLVFLFGIITGALYFALHTRPTKKKIVFHKHSNQHLDFGVMTRLLFTDYSFFLVLAVASYFISQIIYLLFFV